MQVMSHTAQQWGMFLLYYTTLLWAQDLYFMTADKSEAQVNYHE